MIKGRVEWKAMFSALYIIIHLINILSQIVRYLFLFLYFPVQQSNTIIIVKAVQIQKLFRLNNSVWIFLRNVTKLYHKQFTIIKILCSYLHFNTAHNASTNRARKERLEQQNLYIFFVKVQLGTEVPRTQVRPKRVSTVYFMSLRRLF